MNKQIDEIVDNSETIDKATGLYVFSWIRETSARDYLQRNYCYSKRNPETGLFIWTYEPSEPNAKPAQELKETSHLESKMTSRKDKSVAFDTSILAELSSSGCDI